MAERLHARVAHHLTAIASGSLDRVPVWLRAIHPILTSRSSPPPSLLASRAAGRGESGAGSEPQVRRGGGGTQPGFGHGHPWRTNRHSVVRMVDRHRAMSRSMAEADARRPPQGVHDEGRRPERFDTPGESGPSDPGPAPGQSAGVVQSGVGLSPAGRSAAAVPRPGPDPRRDCSGVDRPGSATTSDDGLLQPGRSGLHAGYR